MPVTGDTLALAIMDDDGWGCAITTTPYLTQEQVDAAYAWADDFMRDHIRQPSAGLVQLTWYTSVSADDETHDQEADLDAIGSPGGASWASVSPNGRPGHEDAWAWEIYSRWTDVDDNPQATLACGEADN